MSQTTSDDRNIEDRWVAVLGSWRPTGIVATLGCGSALLGKHLRWFDPDSFGDVGTWIAATATVSLLALTAVQRKEAEAQHTLAMTASKEQHDFAMADQKAKHDAAMAEVRRDRSAPHVTDLLDSAHILKDYLSNAVSLEGPMRATSSKAYRFDAILMALVGGLEKTAGKSGSSEVARETQQLKSDLLILQSDEFFDGNTYVDHIRAVETRVDRYVTTLSSWLQKES
jgi:hypothetical protein